MGILLASFKKNIRLEENKHQSCLIKLPEDFSFLSKTDMVPLGFSELIPVSLFYPIIFRTLYLDGETELVPFAIISVRGTPFYLNPDGRLKIEALPFLSKIYPFGLLYEKGEFFVVVEEKSLVKENVFLEHSSSNEKYELLFEKNGEETAFIQKIKTHLTAFVKDWFLAREFGKELFKAKCLKPVNITAETPFGKVKYKNVFLGDIEGLQSMQPEKLYYFNVKGYLPVLYAVFLSIRNFDLLKIIAKEIRFERSKQESPVLSQPLTQNEKFFLSNAFNPEIS